MRVSEAEAVAVMLMTAAHASDDECARLATRIAFAPVHVRVLVTFCLIEACWSWAPPTTTSSHPVLGLILDHLRTGDDYAARSALVDSMTGKAPGIYAALLVQLAYGTVHLVPNIADRLKTRGLATATDPAAAEERPAGNGR